jgi:hypothetical protein
VLAPCQNDALDATAVQRADLEARTRFATTRGSHTHIDNVPVPKIPTSWSDAHVGEAFGGTLQGRWLYCRSLGGWMRWDARRWLVDPGEAVHEEFRQWIINLGDQIWRSTGDGDEMKLVSKYRERGKIDAAVTIARRLKTIAATPEEFDQHPHLLNVENGVVDLRTGSLLSHDPTLRLTKIAGAAYRPEARSADVDAVLEALEPDVRGWVQRVFGSASFGDVVNDTLIVFDGTGSNGKTTILKAAAHALNEYAVPASTRLLMARGVIDEHPTLLADLFGRRLVYIEETPEGGALKMEQVKNITGGGTLKARFIGKDYFSSEPSHQLIVARTTAPPSTLPTMQPGVGYASCHSLGRTSSHTRRDPVIWSQTAASAHDSPSRHSVRRCSRGSSRVLSPGTPKVVSVRAPQSIRQPQHGGATKT